MGHGTLPVAPRLLVACFFWFIVATVVFPVASVAFNARTFHQSTFVVIIVIATALNVMALIIAIAVRLALCIMQRKLALCLIRATFVLTGANLFAELALQLEVSVLFNTLQLRAFEPTINLALVELHLKALGDAFECLCLKFLAGSDRLITVFLVE
jgi:hypothetical protein